MREFYEQNKALIKKGLYLVLFFVGIYVCVTYVLGYIAPFLIGYIFSLVLEPLANFVSNSPPMKYLFRNNISIRRTIAAFFCLLVLAVVIVFLGATVTAQLISQSKSFTTNLPFYLQETIKAIDKLKVSYNDMFLIIPAELQDTLYESIRAISTNIASTAGNSLRHSSTSFVSAIPVFLISLVLCFVSTFFFIKDKAIIRAVIKEQSPKWMHTAFSHVRRGLFQAIIGYIKAQLIVMSITFSIATVGLTLIRYEYSILVGLLIAFVDALPILGSGSILWPWAALSLISSNYTQAVGLLIIYVCILAVRQIVEPKVLGEQIGVHPLLTLIALYMGLKIFGVFGFIIGPVCVVTLKALLSADISEPVGDA